MNTTQLTIAIFTLLGLVILIGILHKKSIGNLQAKLTDLQNKLVDLKYEAGTK